MGRPMPRTIASVGRRYRVQVVRIGWLKRLYTVERDSSGEWQPAGRASSRAMAGVVLQAAVASDPSSHVQPVTVVNRAA